MCERLWTLLEEGASVLSATYKAEHDLIEAGAIPSDGYLYVAKARPAADMLVRTAFERHASLTSCGA
jgi:hypothetical protein